MISQVILIRKMVRITFATSQTGAVVWGVGTLDTSGSNRRLLIALRIRESIFMT